MDEGDLALTCVTETDAAAVLLHVDAVAGESDFLTFGPGEFGKQLSAETAFLREMNASGSGVMVKATVRDSSGERLAALASIQRSLRARIQHVGTLSVSVLKEFWGRGIGRAVCTRVIAEARSRGVRRIELKVREDNARAIHLYRSLGFVEEARLRQAFRVGDVLFDEVLMAALFEAGQRPG